MNPRDPEGFQAMWISLEKGTIKYMMRFHQPINLYKLKNDSTTWLTTGIPKLNETTPNDLKIFF